MPPMSAESLLHPQPPSSDPHPNPQPEAPSPDGARASDGADGETRAPVRVGELGAVAPVGAGRSVPVPVPVPVPAPAEGREAGASGARRAALPVEALSPDEARASGGADREERAPTASAGSGAVFPGAGRAASISADGAGAVGGAGWVVPVSGVGSGREHGREAGMSSARRVTSSGSEGAAEGGDGQSSGVAGAGAGRGGGQVRRRGPADPVRGVMHRHQDLLSTAVDPWEIAAALEARGISDGDARRLRHRDVFSLAEELFARAPRPVRPPRPAERAREAIGMGGRDAVLHLLPGLATTAAAALRLPPPAALATLVVSAWPALRTGPLRARRAAGWAACAVALLALARCGPHPVGTATLAALALTLFPAAYLARWFAVSARAQLAPSHGLSDFADAVRPRLAAALAAYAAALLVLLAAFGTFRGSALGVLLFAARLLAAHGRARTAACALAAACAGQALCLAVLPPGPAEAATCGTAAVALAVHALRVLPRAAAHRV